VQHAEPIPTSFPWRGATLVVGALAAVELLALIGVIALHFAPKHPVARSAAPTKARPAVQATKRVAAVPSHRLRARSRLHVLVLNGNGTQGAASTEAARLLRAGYRIGGAENALRHDYARSMVLYVPGWVKEAKRLARDTGIKLVAPIDGLTPAKLKASQAVVILGNS